MFKNVFKIHGILLSSVIKQSFSMIIWLIELLFVDDMSIILTIGVK